MPHSFVQWALCFQNVSFKIFHFGLATAHFLIVTGVGSQGINLSLKIIIWISCIEIVWFLVSKYLKTVTCLKLFCA